jgi:hypothetical protein
VAIAPIIRRTPHETDHSNEDPEQPTGHKHVGRCLGIAHFFALAPSRQAAARAADRAIDASGRVRVNHRKSERHADGVITYYPAPLRRHPKSPNSGRHRSAALVVRQYLHSEGSGSLHDLQRMPSVQPLDCVGQFLAVQHLDQPLDRRHGVWRTPRLEIIPDDQSGFFERGFENILVFHNSFLGSRFPQR